MLHKLEIGFPTLYPNIQLVVVVTVKAEWIWGFCLDREKQTNKQTSPKELEVLSFSCDFTSVANTEVLWASVSLFDHVHGVQSWVHVWAIRQPFEEHYNSSHLFTFFRSVLACLPQLYVLGHHSSEWVPVGLKHWHLCVRCSKLESWMDRCRQKEKSCYLTKSSAPYVVLQVSLYVFEQIA